MKQANRMAQKTIINLEMLNALNEKGCSACNRKFALGDPVVLACGPWGDGQRLIHEHEAFFDRKTGTYVDRRCLESIRPGSGS